MKSSFNVSQRFWKLIRFPQESKEKFKTFLRKFQFRSDLYLVGGCIRDVLLNREFLDVDLTAGEDVDRLCSYLGSFLGFTVVVLSSEFGTYRLAKGKNNIDFTLLRGETIEEDLGERDFTINALALRAKDLFKEDTVIIDPYGGLRDLSEGIIRAIRERNLVEDPLRILRGYRFFALGFGKLDELTRRYFKRHASLVYLCAKERIYQELLYVLSSKRAYESFVLMDEDGVLREIIPWIKDCEGVEQPSFHHLDVKEHLFEALNWAEKLLNKEVSLLKKADFLNEERFKDEDFRVKVKLAAFFHDIGKAYTFEIRDRITFYGHEKVSVDVFNRFAEEYRFKTSLKEGIANLIRNHMRPFQLLNEKEKGRLTLRAKRNLIRDVDDLEGLFLVCMADSLASQGEDKEPDYEERLIEFFREIFEVKRQLENQTKVKRVITGHDLIALGLKPGPIFKEILQEIEILVLEGRIKSREQAIDFVKKKYLILNL